MISPASHLKNRLFAKKKTVAMKYEENYFTMELKFNIVPEDKKSLKRKKDR